MKTFIILVRHGESENNILLDRKKRKKDPVLTSQGQIQIIESIKAIKTLLNNDKFEIWSSPFKRAIESALIASEQLENLKIRIIKELHEIEGFVDIDIKDTSKYFSVDSPTYSELTLYDKDRIFHLYKGEEVWWNNSEVDNIENRLEKLFKIFLIQKGVNILAFTHGDLIKSIYKKVHNKKYDKKISNASVHILTINESPKSFSIKEII